MGQGTKPGRKRRQEKEKAGTQGVGLVAERCSKRRPVGFDRCKPDEPAAA
jgi:hypothetical protein